MFLYNSFMIRGFVLQIRTELRNLAAFLERKPDDSEIERIKSIINNKLKPILYRASRLDCFRQENSLCWSFSAF